MFDKESGHFKNFTRMSTEDFFVLLESVGEIISKKDTRFREAIPAKLRLAVTLRFLATGDSYSSLQYLFRMSKQSISRIIPEVCSAISAALSSYIKVSINLCIINETLSKNNSSSLCLHVLVVMVQRCCKLVPFALRSCCPSHEMDHNTYESDEAS
jgi:hypothetical protein